MPATFIVQCLESGVDPESIEQKIDEWHLSDSSHTLREYLGFTPEEYAVWIHFPEAISAILHSRWANIPLESAISSQTSDGLAARALTDEEGRKILSILKKCM